MEINERLVSPSENQCKYLWGCLRLVSRLILVAGCSSDRGGFCPLQWSASLRGLFCCKFYYLNITKINKLKAPYTKLWIPGPIFWRFSRFHKAENKKMWGSKATKGALQRSYLLLRTSLHQCVVHLIILFISTMWTYLSLSISIPINGLFGGPSFCCKN